MFSDAVIIQLIYFLVMTTGEYLLEIIKVLAPLASALLAFWVKNKMDVVKADVHHVKDLNIEQTKTIETVKEKVDQIGVDVDGKMEKLLIATGAKEKAEGIVEGIQQQKAEAKQEKVEAKEEERKDKKIDNDINGIT